MKRLDGKNKFVCLLQVGLAATELEEQLSSGTKTTCKTGLSRGEKVRMFRGRREQTVDSL